MIAWQNDGSPFTGTWTQNDVGASTSGVQSVAVGDLDNDGDLDIASGGGALGEGYEVIAWQNDGTPYSGYWTQNDVGATQTVWSVAMGDLDKDGDLDIVSGSYNAADYEVMAWQNTGGSAGYTVTDTAPAQLGGSSSDDDVMKMVVTHNGISGDNHLEINEWDFLLEVNTGSWGAMTTANAQGLFDNLHIYKDDGDGSFDGEDTLVKTIASASFSLSSGVQTFTFSDNDANLEIADTSSATYFLVVDMDADSETYASTNSITNIRFTFDPDADSLNDDDTTDTTVSVADSSGTQVPVEMIPEFGHLAVPVLAVTALFIVVRRKRRKRQSPRTRAHGGGGGRA